MRCFILILFVLIGFSAQSQRKSNLYNEIGQFYLDTTLTITQSQYKIWSQAEHNIIAGLSQINFPQIYLENNIKAKGILIASFICDSSDIREVKLLRDSSGYPAYSLAVINGLQEQGKKIAARLKVKAKNFSMDTLYMGMYYVAFDFVIIDFYEEMQTRKSIPIIKGNIPTIEVRSH